MRKASLLLPILGGLIFFGFGCISVSSGGSTGSSGADGGLFRSADRGDSWDQKVSLLSADGKTRFFSRSNVIALAQDPQQPSAIYVGTDSDGLFYSYDRGESWQQPTQVSDGPVRSIAVDPQDKCTVFAAYTNRLVKTEDCSRTWEIAYVDARSDRSVTAVRIDPNNSRSIWISTDGGDVLRSADGGRSWTSVQTFRSAVVDLALVAGDGRRAYAATEGHGLWRTDDSGASWKDLSDNYKKQFSGSMEGTSALAVGTSDPAVVILANRYGLIRSRDFGESWEEVSLLTPPKSTVIYSLAVDPKDSSYLYYGTATTFYGTSDGGSNWVPKTLPTTRAATALMVDSQDSSVLYMGVTKFK